MAITSGNNVIVQPIVEIVLSTYNGEKYLKALLDSILCQTYKNWRVLIRDDVSQDSTLEIILDYGKQYPGRFLVMENFNLNLGPSQSFSRLLDASTADYIAFCDQDDVWVPDKLGLQMTALMDLEHGLGRDMPILVHSDLLLCDSQMNIMAASFWSYQNIMPDKMSGIQCLLMQNFVTGCTLLINRALCQSSVPIPREALMFDWWLALVAGQTGKTISISTPLVMYRQHDNNAVGAKKWGANHILSKILGWDGCGRASFFKTKTQAKALYQHLKTGGNNDLNGIKEYIELHQMAWILRKIFFFFIGIRRYLMLKIYER